MKRIGIIGAMPLLMAGAMAHPMPAQRPAPTVADAYNEYADATQEAAAKTRNFARRHIQNPNVQAKPKGGNSGRRKAPGVSSLANPKNGAYKKREKKRVARKARKKAERLARLDNQRLYDSYNPRQDLANMATGALTQDWGDAGTPRPISEMLAGYPRGASVPARNTPMGAAVTNAMLKHGRVPLEGDGEPCEGRR